MKPHEFRSRLAELSSSVWTVATLRVAFESGIVSALPGTTAALAERTGAHPSIVAGVLDVLVALGLVEKNGDELRATEALAPFTKAPAHDVVRADLRATLGQAMRFVDDARARDLQPGWRHVDGEIIEAQATLSLAITPPIFDEGVARLDGAIERLRSGGAFLDVGAGAAGHAIGVARLFASARVVGLEPAEMPYRLACANVARAGLGDRIEMRKQRVEELEDRDAFDVAYVAQMFFPDDVLVEAFARVRRALRPGGWVTTAAVAQDGEGIGPALSRLRGTLWGGGPRTIEGIEAAAARAGFTDIRRVEIPRMPPAFAARRT